ncbi:MAG: hypothetical protein H6713_04155 [Myxococcales bacterium]|nr:hypothetical protein [Myxococcales bacterium]
MTARAPDAPARRAAFAFAAAITVLAPLVRELYPLSAPTMFAYPLRQRVVYELRAPDGRRLPAADFALQINNPHDPPVTTLGRRGYGKRSPTSLHTPGVAPSDAAARRHVARLLARRPELAYVDLTRRVIGDVDGRRVGERARARWRVHNPRAREASR